MEKKTNKPIFKVAMVFFLLNLIGCIWSLNCLDSLPSMNKLHWHHLTGLHVQEISFYNDCKTSGYTYFPKFYKFSSISIHENDDDNITLVVDEGKITVKFPSDFTSTVKRFIDDIIDAANRNRQITKENSTWSEDVFFLGILGGPEALISGIWLKYFSGVNFTKLEDRYISVTRINDIKDDTQIIDLGAEEDKYAAQLIVGMRLGWLRTRETFTVYTEFYGDNNEKVDLSIFDTKTNTVLYEISDVEKDRDYEFDKEGYTFTYEKNTFAHIRGLFVLIIIIWLFGLCIFLDLVSNVRHVKKRKKFYKEMYEDLCKFQKKENRIVERLINAVHDELN